MTQDEMDVYKLSENTNNACIQVQIAKAMSVTQTLSVIVSWNAQSVFVLTQLMQLLCDRLLYYCATCLN